jgi:hypothetical protein
VSAARATRSPANLFGRVLALVVTALVIAGLYGVFADNRAVEAQARRTACASRGARCEAAMTRLLRTPFFQDFAFRVGRRVVDVRCRRAFYLAGSYACALRDRG